MLHEEYGQVNWYFLPIEMQQTFLMIMAHNNRLTTIHGYGNILCIRDTFKKVIFNDNLISRVTVKSDVSLFHP